MTKITRPLPKCDYYEPCADGHHCNPCTTSAYCVDCMLRDFRHSLVEPAKELKAELLVYSLFFNLDTPALVFIKELLKELDYIENLLLDNFQTLGHDEVIDDGN